MNLYGGVKKFVKDYGGDYFDEERVEWFMKMMNTPNRKYGFLLVIGINVFPSKN